MVVSPTGDVEITPDTRDHPDDVERARRQDALRWGWAEPLRWVRLGYELTLGSAVVAPGGSAAMVLRGQIHDLAVLVGGLASEGWQVLADRFVPLRWSDAAIELQPTDTPVLVARRRAAQLGLEGTRVRLDSDAVVVDVPRVGVPMPLGAVVEVQARRVGAAVLEPLEGHARFELASKLPAGAALQPEGVSLPPTERMARDLRVASLPACRVHLDLAAPTEGIEALGRWWAEVGCRVVAGGVS